MASSVLNAAHPVNPTRPGIRASYVSWSPDGRWLACLIRPSPRVERELIVVASPTPGGERDTLYDGPRAWPYVWGCDGRIYYWDEQAARVRHTRWRAKMSDPPRSQAQLVSMTGRMGLPRLMLFDTCSGSEVTLTSVPRLDSLAGPTGYCLAQDEFTDGKRFLIHGPSTYSHGGGGLVVDGRGTVLDTLGWQVYWTAVSGDGNLSSDNRRWRTATPS
jgi:hypothetical protein